MKKRLAVFVIVLAGVSSPIAIPAASASPAHIACSASYVSANLPWGHKCLRAGEFCKVGNKAYRRYGFTCPANGHLRRR
jgi:hypothetical protein